MDPADLQKKLLASFLGELEERTREIEQDTVALDKQPSSEAQAEHLRSILRALHTLKGAARAVGSTAIERTCHSMEGLFAAIQAGARPFWTPASAGVTDASPSLRRAPAESRSRAQDGPRRLGPGQPESTPDTKPRACGDSHGSRDSIDSADSRDAPDAMDLLFELVRGLGDARERLARDEPADGGALGDLLAKLGQGAAKPLPEARAGADTAPAPETKPEPLGAVRVSTEKLDRLFSAQTEVSVALMRAAVEKCVSAFRESFEILKRSSKSAPGRADGALASLSRLERELDQVERALEAERDLLARAVAALEEAVRQTRLLPFGEACEGLERTARDVARSIGKEVEIRIQGAAIELDRGVLDSLKGPLVQLVRNAIDHGIEPPAERLASGKAPAGRITVSAELEGELVSVSVADDGRGFDRGAIRAEAARRGLAATAGEPELLRALFSAGFTTAAEVTGISGRGVGLDAVKSQVEKLRGSVELSDSPGAGVSCRMIVPQTLAKVRAVLVRAAGGRYALPTFGVERALRLARSEVTRVEGRDTVPAGASAAPLSSLARVLGQGEERAVNGRFNAVVLAGRGLRHAFSVEALESEQELVVRSLGERMTATRMLIGGAILPDGEIALVLDPAEVVARAFREAAAPSLAAADDRLSPRKRRLLLADDSVTTRNLERIILESAGYEVLSAVDGADAWRILEEHEVDLVVSDVQMPGMDGVALTEAIRASRRLEDLPVVLVTGLSSDADRRRGLAAGANAYVVKSAFDQQDLLDVIAKLL